MGKLSLQPNPTFKAKVGIPVAGDEPADVEFTFKHRAWPDLLAWVEASKDKTDVEVVQDLAVGWELDDAFTAENITRLCENYAGANAAIYAAYLRELRGVRTKN